MPQLLFRGVPAEKLQTISQPLSEELALICECGTDNFTMEYVHTTAIYGGLAEGQSYPFVEVGWFERGQAVRDRFAKAVTEQLARIGVHELEVAFRTYREDSYYINGRPCSQA
ncbi:DUF1904 family protein [Paenibacillus glycanilyticus]|uniref:DUF1904 family protein n=1 Tax=Paenibacillus glycanilyticus TaxID=126569 RepID=A0ABQ6G9J9_9BACL|nr:DUF1904 family protein [Paenibacillus glycanilyticus]GLX67651.1 hypothetical protein MU1_19960 [Paenibacillus glycanilyticus]